MEAPFLSFSHPLDLITVLVRRETDARSLGVSGSPDRRTGDGEIRSSLPEGASGKRKSSIAYGRFSHIIILAVALTFSYSLAQAQSSSAPGQIKKDTTAPVGSLSINGNAAYTKATAVALTLSATDGVGVTGYYRSSSPAAPSANATGWWAVTSTASYNGSAGYGGLADIPAKDRVTF